MALLVPPAPARPGPPVGAGRPGLRRGLLVDLHGASPVAHVGPNWFAPVMGTGIVAVALVGLPFPVPGGAQIATGVWGLATLLLVAVGAATLAHHRRHPVAARGHLDSPTMAPFYGAPAMALMTVGAGALLVGHRVVGHGPALALAAVLWTAGTLLGLATTVAVPLRAVARHGLAADAALGSWLMPVVPPMVSAATGALLLPHLPVGPARATLLLLCYALAAVSLVAAVVVVVLVVRRLVRLGVGPAATAPTLLVVLGPLGQSVTAVHHLGLQAPDVLGRPYGPVLSALTLGYGVPVWGGAMLWLALASTLVARTARREGLPFSLAWWSFTFPVGTVVTGTSALATTTGLLPLQVVAGVLFALLVVAWLVVLVRTLAGVHSGRLLLAPTPAR